MRNKIPINILLKIFNVTFFICHLVPKIIVFKLATNWILKETFEKIYGIVNVMNNYRKRSNKRQ